MIKIHARCDGQTWGMAMTEFSRDIWQNNSTSPRDDCETDS